MRAKILYNKDLSYASTRSGVSHVQSEPESAYVGDGDAREIHTMRDFEVSSTQMSV